MDEIIDAEFEPEIENKEIIIPITNLLDKPIAQEGEIDRLISDDKLLSVYQDVLTAVQKDREEISEILQSFLDMVLNEGDATSACKEAVVSLVKAKSETNDQVIKIADLMTRVKMKERNTFNPAIHAHQQNIYNLGKTDEDKDVLKPIQLSLFDQIRSKLGV
jgi:predicted RecB family endonuclease